MTAMPVVAGLSVDLEGGKRVIRTHLNKGWRMDPRDLPIYTVPDAAHYLRIPPSTLKSWVVGRPYRTKSGVRHAEPLIRTPGAGSPRLLSFFNVVEAHILSALRRVHQVPMENVRRAIAQVEEDLGSKHPLIDARFKTDGVNLFVEHCDHLMDQNGQFAIRKAIEAHLERIEWEPGMHGLAVRLYPFIIEPHQPDERKTILIDPRRAFGRPVLAGTGIQTAVIASRHRAGESIHELAQDYNLPVDKVEDAIRCELRGAA
ncbi:MAG: DUF433 domain-containing protein [Polyangiaceae bacterium]|nr:DUF433 domain-containing protein [Polyangiaceae bacterium]